MTNKTTPDDDWLSELVYMALGEESAVFMSQPIKGTEIVMPETEITGIAEPLIAAINAKITELLVEARIDELERLYLVYGSKDKPASLDNLFSLGSRGEACATPIRDRKAQLQASKPINLNESEK